MTIFSLLESFFFLFLGISFILVLLMVYHFKKKLDTIERKNETLQDICKTICEELDFVKSQSQSQPQLVKTQNIDPFYLNYHPANQNNNSIDQEFLPNVSELFKTILVSGGGNSIPDALDIQNYENEELDDVHSYEEDFEYQEETDTTDSSVEEVEDFEEENQDRVFVLKLDEHPDEHVFNPEESRVEELDQDIEEEILEIREEIEEEIEAPIEKPLDEIDDMESKFNSTKAALQKLTLQMLRTMVIKEGLCTDPSKLKKLDLIQIVLDSQYSKNSL